MKRHLGSSQGSFETSWTKIHSLVEQQHIDIKKSLEKSSAIVQHDLDHDADLRELQGFVSASAMPIIIAEAKRADLDGVNVHLCGCLTRRTYGLPCAHEIAEYKKAGRPIPLDCVDPHWRKLDLVLGPRKQTVELSCEVELELIAKRFNEQDNAGKLQILKKLKEIANSESTSVVEPAANVNVQGGSPSNVDCSTSCNPSGSQLELSTEDSYSPGVSGGMVTNAGPSNGTVEGEK